MPIYAYRCTSCGHAQDVLRKVSDPPLTVCPACGAASFAKQVTAAGFQLKGSGWYVTDFRDGNKAAAKKGDEAKPAAGDGEKAAADKVTDKVADKADKPAGKPVDKPAGQTGSAAAPAAAAPSAPAAPTPTTGS